MQGTPPPVYPPPPPRGTLQCDDVGDTCVLRTMSYLAFICNLPHVLMYTQVHNNTAADIVQILT